MLHVKLLETMRDNFFVFKLRLADTASNCFHALPINQKDTFDNLTASFLTVFNEPNDQETVKFATND
jgi:hypothetical protein